METVKLKSGLKYREVITRNGKREKSPCFKRKTDAKQWKADQLLKREKEKLYGVDYKEVKQTKLTDFSNQWLERKIKPQRSQSTYDEYRRILTKKIIPIVSNKFLHKVVEADAHKLVEVLGQVGHNKGGINKILALFKQVLEEAEKNDLILKNPLRNVSKLKEDKRAPTYWQESDTRRFLLATKDHYLYSLYVIALNTGMRRGELFGLQWDKVSFNRSMLEVSRIKDRHGLRNTTKNKRTRFVPMNPIVKAILLRLHSQRTNDYVFTKEDGSLIDPHHAYRDFQKAQLKANVDITIRFHDLRHTFASHFMMNGGNLYDLQKILGHSKADMTQIYAHLSPEHLSKTTEILDFHGEEIETTPKSTQDNIAFI